MSAAGFSWMVWRVASTSGWAASRSPSAARRLRGAWFKLRLATGSEASGQSSPASVSRWCGLSASIAR
jgi:hypothetical protein